MHVRYLYRSDACDFGMANDTSTLYNIISECPVDTSTLYHCNGSALLTRGVVSGLISLDPLIVPPTCEMLDTKIDDDKGPSPATNCRANQPHM